MKTTIRLTLALLFASIAPLPAEEPKAETYDARVDQRLTEGIAFIQARPWPASAVATAMIQLHQNENIDEANRLLTEHVASLTNAEGEIVPEGRPEGLSIIARDPQAEFLSMEHGTNKAVISHPNYEDVVLEF